MVNVFSLLFVETNSTDEAMNISWCLSLLARWEGIDWAITVIEQKLWPFLQRWSSGQGTNIGAAAAITALGTFLKCSIKVRDSNHSYLHLIDLYRDAWQGGSSSKENRSSESVRSYESFVALRRK